MTYFIIEHPRRGVYMEHRISTQTGKSAPRFTLHVGQANKEPKKFETRQAAQKVIDRDKSKDAKGLNRCSIIEKPA